MGLDYNTDSRNDTCPQKPAPKKMSDALLDVAASGRTSNKQLQAIDIAYVINRTSGGHVIAPWEVGGLSQDWIDTLLMFSTDLPKMRNGMREIEKRKAEIVSKHKTYRPIRKH